MMHRRSICVATAAGVLIAPLAVWADPTGSVTTAPVHQAPALEMSVLALLAVALTAITVYRLQRRGRRRILGLGVVIGVVALAGLVYASFPTITIGGASCAMQTVTAFNPAKSQTVLTSNCPNSIQIVDIHVTCDGGGDVVAPNASTEKRAVAVGPCSVGQILASGESCLLPGCVT